ncbi:hypothetical protein [Haliscomenobacter sp.]|uniref:hypothetical protein n=1 Tax=Haliscomenobacter sp. TaxID=2717303 RepID=UPI0033651645
MKLSKIARFPKMMLWAFWMEGVETKQMVKTFVKHGRGKIIKSSSKNGPTPEELQQAREQLKDLPKFLPFFMCIVVPVPGITEGYAVLAVTLESWLGHKISLLPSQIRGVFVKMKEEDNVIEGELDQTLEAALIEELEKDKNELN